MKLAPATRMASAALALVFAAGPMAQPKGAPAQAFPKYHIRNAERHAAPKRPVAETPSVNAEDVFAAIVKVTTHAIPGARSSSSLGSDREGTGIVIGEKGLILTIGYLIVEAEDVSVVDSNGRNLSARVVGYDHATGFGLVRTIAPMDAKPVALGESASVKASEPVMIASSGDDTISFAYVVSKRPFSGNWEYALDEALYTSPPMNGWSGAGLFDRDGKLIGVGSLIVRQANEAEPRVPGNMFVPIDLLKPILADLVAEGRRKGPARPWLGIAADEVSGRLVVARVSPGGPAEAAGIGPGDIILGVGGDTVRTQADFYRKVWARGGAGESIPLKLLQGADVKEIPVASIDRTEYFKRPTTY